MTMADEIAVMHEGRVEQRGSADDLYERPRTEFVASFLGLSNLIDGRLEGSEGVFATVRTAAGIALRVPAERLGGATGDVRVGVRPEKVTLRAPEAGGVPGENLLPATVTVASYLGVALQYVVTLADGQELTVIAQNTGGRHADAVAPGREVVLAWDPQHTFVVEQETA